MNNYVGHLLWISFLSPTNQDDLIPFHELKEKDHGDLVEEEGETTSPSWPETGQDIDYQDQDQGKDVQREDNN